MSSAGGSAEAQSAAEDYRALFHAMPEQIAVDEIRQATKRRLFLGPRDLPREVAGMLGRRMARRQPGRPPRRKAHRIST